MPPTEPANPAGGEEAVPAPGVVIGSRYLVEGMLGRGGMSVVLRARDLRLGHGVALKILCGSQSQRSEQTRRFLREAQIVAQLKSDHVVSVLDVDAVSEPPYLAMELLEGDTVAELLTAYGRFPTDVAVRVVAQACRGVADAHALGVVHRDLKPSNLFVVRAADGSQRVKVIDFGISKPVVRDATKPSVTTTGQILGSPRYMSPEQVRGGEAIDARSDIWALGTILYELVAGTTPFDAPTVADTLARVVRDTPAPLSSLVPDVPPRVAAIVALCLSKDPALRPQDARTLLEELAAMVPPAPLSLSAAQASPRSRGSIATTQGTGVRSWSLARQTLSLPITRASRPTVVAGIVAFGGLAAWFGLQAALHHSPPPREIAASLGSSASSVSLATVTASEPVVPEAPVPPRPLLQPVEAAPPVPDRTSYGRAKAGSAPAPGAPRTQDAGARTRDDDLELNRRE